MQTYLILFPVETNEDLLNFLVKTFVFKMHQRENLVPPVPALNFFKKPPFFPQLNIISEMQTDVQTLPTLFDVN